MSKKIAFVTIGQSPRDDIVPEILARLPIQPAYDEFGALDGLSAEAIAALAPQGEEARLVSRLRDGGEVLLAKARMQALLQGLFEQLDGRGYDLVVLLCTGHFRPFSLQTPLLEAQLAVDHFVLGLTYGLKRLGVVLPNERQRQEFHGIDGKEIRAAHASPYADGDFAAAAHDLAGSDAIVLHCMGYSEAMGRDLAALTGRPVLLSRRLVASAVGLLLE